VLRETSVEVLRAACLDLCQGYLSRRSGVGGCWRMLTYAMRMPTYACGQELTRHAISMNCAYVDVCYAYADVCLWARAYEACNQHELCIR